MKSSSEDISGGLSQSKRQIFETKNIPSAVFYLAFPTVISQIVMTVYNFADTWFVGRTQNPKAVAALTVCAPFYAIMNGISTLFGIGGSSAIARKLGKKDFDGAENVFKLSIAACLTLALLYSAVTLIFIDKLLVISGTPQTAYKSAHSYLLFTTVIGGIPAVLSGLFGQLVRSTGNSRAAAVGISLGALLNLGLDPLFIFVLFPKGFEVTAAAIATLLSNIVSCIFFIILITAKRDTVLSFSLKQFRFDKETLYDVVMTGLPAASGIILAMVSNIFANSLISSAGTDALAGLGVAKKSITLAFNISMGITQGVLPLAAYCYSSGNYSRMKKAALFSGASALIFSAVCTLIFIFFGKNIISFFIDSPQTIEYGDKYLRIMALAVPMCALTYSVNTIFQAAGKKLCPFILSLLRKGPIDIPLMYIFKGMYGYSGVLYATPTAELVSAATAIFMTFVFFKNMKKARRK